MTIPLLIYFLVIPPRRLLTCPPPLRMQPFCVQPGRSPRAPRASPWGRFWIR